MLGLSFLKKNLSTAANFLCIFLKKNREEEKKNSSAFALVPAAAVAFCRTPRRRRRLPVSRRQPPLPNPRGPRAQWCTGSSPARAPPGRRRPRTLTSPSSRALRAGTRLVLSSHSSFSTMNQTEAVCRIPCVPCPIPDAAAWLTPLLLRFRRLSWC